MFLQTYVLQTSAQHLFSLSGEKADFLTVKLVSHFLNVYNQTLAVLLVIFTEIPVQKQNKTKRKHAGALVNTEDFTEEIKERAYTAAQRTFCLGGGGEKSH